jgi:hypothetical protein
VATLGWDRIILLFNTDIGKFPADLPFDFAQNRGSPYSYGPEDPNSKRQELAKLLYSAIKLVLEKNPKRPAELKGLSREKIEHDHDVENIRSLMETLHIPTLEDHIEELPHRITEKAFWFWDTFRGVAGSRLFSVYDPVLRDEVDKFYNGWNKVLSHSEQYNPTHSGTTYVFSSPGDMPLVGKRDIAWKAIDAGRHEMADGLAAILDRLRANYVEVNIRESNNIAWNRYVDFQKRVEARFGKKPQRTKKK